jgi:hypothetical protein
MKTPETKAGRLTELVMARVRGKLPELPTHEYNRVYECVLAELNCHVLGETYEIQEITPPDSKCMEHIKMLLESAGSSKAFFINAGYTKPESDKPSAPAEPSNEKS